jgi:hypothetical protein
LSIALYFSDLIKPREVIPSGTCYQRLLDRVLDFATIDLESWRFSCFSSPFLMFGGQNGVITFSASLQESIVSNWILIMWRGLMRYSFYLVSLLLEHTHICYVFLLLFSLKPQSPLSIAEVASRFDTGTKTGTIYHP